MAGDCGVDIWMQGKRRSDAYRWQYAIIPFMSEDDTLRMYDLVGGDEKLRELVDRFYDLMDLESGFAELRAMHPPSLDISREKLYRFLSGWTGGPDLYVEQFGHPKLRMRHFPFAIGARERDEWLWCMDQALTEHAMSEELRGYLRLRMHQLADHMRNQPE